MATTATITNEEQYAYDFCKDHFAGIQRRLGYKGINFPFDLENLSATYVETVMPFIAANTFVLAGEELDRVITKRLAFHGITL